MSSLKKIALLAATLIAVACGDDSVVEPDPATGSIEVNAVTTGEDTDADGYTVSAGGESEPLPVNGMVVFNDVTEGQHSVELTGVADNCEVGGTNPRDVTVTAESVAETTFDVACTRLPPAIDGDRSPDEWADATSVSAFSGATFFYLNDAEDLYIALEVDDAALEDGDRFDIRFDNENDGTFDPGEDHLGVTGGDNFQDKHSTASSWGDGDIEVDGDGAAGSSSGTNFFEIVHPLDSGDADDFSLESGDVVGYCIRYYDDGTSTSSLTYPTSCVTAGDDLSGYAELTVE